MEFKVAPRKLNEIIPDLNTTPELEKELRQRVSKGKWIMFILGVVVMWLATLLITGKLF